ncbi:hypothetical protein GCM10020370_47220 [Paenibacillus hodogayensis]
MNGMEMPLAINESNKAQYADRYNSQEAVDPQSGSLSINVTDLVLPGRDGLDFSLTRHYNSNQAQMGEMKSAFSDTSSSTNYYKDSYYWFYILEYYTNSGSGPYQYLSIYFRTEAEAIASCTSNATAYTNYTCRLRETDGSLYWDELSHDYIRAPLSIYRRNFTWASTAEKTSYQRSRYDLGAGWSLGIPSVQIIRTEPDDGKELHFHDGSGASYRIFFTPADDSNIQGYPRDNVRFDIASGGSYSNGQAEAQYVFTDSDNRKTYFAQDGRILGIKDRFGNEIKFTHTMRYVNGTAYPYISKITDSIGRIIQFTYDNTIDNASFTEDNVTVTVTHPNEPGMQTGVVYSKKRHSIDGRYEPYLYSAIIAPNTPETTATYYEYETRAQRFQYQTKNVPDQNSASVYTQLLKKIIYPHSVAFYDYETALRNLGTSGVMEAFRVTERYDLNRVGSAIPSIPKTNLALNKPVQVSSYSTHVSGGDGEPEETHVYYGHYAVDGDSRTAWESMRNSEEWIYVDLGSVQPFNEVVLRWANKGRYTIQVSNDAMNWTHLYAGMGVDSYYNEMYAEDIRGLQGNARFIKIIVNLPPYTSVTVSELEIYNHLGKNQVGYSYVRDYSGYPYASFPHSSKTFAGNLIQTQALFNGEGQPVSAESRAPNGEIQSTTNETFDNKYKYKPTRTKYLDKNSANASLDPLYVDRLYYSWGGLASETRPLSLNDINNSAIKADHTTNYQYSIFYYPSQIQRKQTASTTLTDSTEYYDSPAQLLAGRLKKTTNANGEYVDYTYELTTEGKVSKAIATQTLENGKTARTETVYGPTGIYAFPTQITQFYTDDNNQPQTMQTSRTYSLVTGLLQSETAPGGRVTTYQYDALGRPIAVKQPPFNGLNGVTYEVETKTEYAPNQISSGFDATNANVQTMKVKTYTSVRNVSTNGVTIYDVKEAFYDGFGNPLIQQRYDDQRGQWITEAQYHYDAMSRPIYVADAQNNVQTVGYDGWGQVGQVTDPYGNQYKTIRDLLGRKTTSYMVTSSNASNPDDNVKWNVLEKQYDPLGRLTTSTVYPSWPDRNNKVQAAYTYDFVGNALTMADPKNQVTSYQYDKLNRLVKITDPLSQATDYTYTTQGKLKETKQSDAGQTYTTSKTYDELGRIRQNFDAASQADLLTYNAVGDLSQRRDLNQQTFSYGYDALHRQVSSNVGANSVKTYYEDNPFGPKQREEWSGGNLLKGVAYTYGANGQLTGKTVTSDGHTLSMTNAFDLAGKLTGVTNGYGFTTAYQYDKVRVEKVQTNGGAANPGVDDSQYARYEYNPNGTLKTITYPRLSDGTYMKSDYAYDKISRLTSVTNTKGGQAISSYSYAYDANGNITAVTDGAGTTAYVYDALNRLIQTTRPDGQIVTYTYDGRGNRKTSQGDSMALREGSFAYSPWNELIQATDGTGTTGYTYSPESEGLRIKKTTPSGTLRYTYNASGQVIAESDANNQVIAQYVWGPDRLLMKKDMASGQSYYYVHNGHGDVVQLMNTAGAVVNSYRYDEWGNILQQAEGVPNAFKYAGEPYDPETGFYYLRARYYDPSVGRFINKDTYEGDISNPLSLNLYTYVYNNPLRYTDPNGHDPRELQLMLEMARDGEYNMQDARSKLGAYYQRIFQDDDNNYFNYLFGLATLTSAYENSMGRSEWAIGVLVQVNIADNVSAYELAQLLESMVDVNAALSRGAKAARARVPLKTSAECNCFTAGTKVLTDEGEKPIEEIEVGDKVLAKDNETSEMAYKEVEWLFQRDVEETYNITIGDEVITTTDEHPFWIVGKGWVESKNLVLGEVLTTSDGKELAIEKIEIKKEHKTVYNFKVKDFHTYFVSNLGIWTHNSCTPDFITNNRVPIDKETALGNGTFTKTKISPVKGAQIYKNGDNYYHRDTFHTGEGSHLEVYDKRGNHLGEADVLTGKLIPGTRDPDKKINVK